MSAGMNMAPFHAPVHVTLDSMTHHVVVTTGPWKLPPMMMDGDMPMMNMAGMGEGHEATRTAARQVSWPEIHGCADSS